MNAQGTAVNIAAYSKATHRQNLINQTDLLLNLRTGPVEHRILAGLKLSAVRIPGFTRFDAALFWNVTEWITAQVNVENLFGARNNPVAENNNNITPGAPFAARFAVTTRF